MVADRFEDGQVDGAAVLSGWGVVKADVQGNRRRVVRRDSEEDLVVAECCRLLFQEFADNGSEPLAACLWVDEQVLDLGPQFVAGTEVQGCVTCDCAVDQADDELVVSF